MLSRFEPLGKAVSLSDGSPTNSVRKSHICGQIIATSHNLGPQKVAFWKGNPLISGKFQVGEIL